MDGIIVVNKPKGLTSHDVVDILRKTFGIAKVGHAGTLDPMATGVLVMLLGRYTKSAQTFLSDDKEYSAELTLGAVSDTCDAWGKISEPFSPVDLTDGEIEDAFRSFMGEIEQSPPAYSAVKVKGKRLYKLARKGIRVEVKARRVVVKDLEVVAVKLPRVSFRLTCSKGFYVRQLASDIGEKLGCGAYLSGLERTRSGRFTLGQALDIAMLEKFKREDLEVRLLK